MPNARCIRRACRSRSQPPRRAADSQHRARRRRHLDRSAFPQSHAQQQRRRSTSSTRSSAKDARGRLKPALAESWRAVDDLTWEFKLRKGVKFHDGSRLHRGRRRVHARPRARRSRTARRRSPPTASRSPRRSSSIRYTIRLKTATPYPLMPNDMGTILIVSSRAAKGASTEDFNSGKATIGTGPFKFVRWQKGDRIELARNDGYWGPKPPWDRVTFRIITSDPTRVASLLAGEVRAIENVPDRRTSRSCAKNAISRSTASSRIASCTCTSTARATNRRSSPTRPASRSTRIRSRTCACGARCPRRSTARRSSSA